MYIEVIFYGGLSHEWRVVQFVFLLEAKSRDLDII